MTAKWRLTSEMGDILAKVLKQKGFGRCSHTGTVNRGIATLTCNTPTGWFDRDPTKKFQFKIVIDVHPLEGR